MQTVNLDSQSTNGINCWLLAEILAAQSQTSS